LFNLTTTSSIGILSSGAVLEQSKPNSIMDIRQVFKMVELSSEELLAGFVLFLGSSRSRLQSVTLESS
jgi:hypothetical protein